MDVLTPTCLNSISKPMAEEEKKSSTIISIWERLDSLPGEPMKDEPFTIFRAPAYIREGGYKDLYEPTVVSIGPLHRGKEGLRSMEEHKWRYLRDLLFDVGSSSQVRGNLLKEMKELEPRVRRCYNEHIPLPSDEFVQMMLLDGCFILGFLVKWCFVEGDIMFKVGWNLPHIKADLLKLENQIPFLILEKLYSIFSVAVPGWPGDPGEKLGRTASLMDIALIYLTAGSETKIETIHRPGDGDVKHLLHLYHICYVPIPKPHRGPNCFNLISDIIKSVLKSRFPLLKRMCWSSRPSKNKPYDTIPSATELVEAGVTIKMKKMNSDGSFLDISFHNGTLEIPHFYIEPSYKPLYVNLYLFEQSSNDPNKYWSAYTNFMDCLIDNAKDIAILTDLGIIENNLPTAKELANFINQFTQFGTLDFNKHYLKDLFIQVNEYCLLRWHRWRGSLIRQYFTNPWAFLSLLAAIIVLILTFLQTFFAIYAYYQPPHA